MEGLDLSGKSTVAKYLAEEIDEHEYIKVSKGDIFNYSDLDNEKAINGRIMQEMAAATEDKEDIIMDRAAVSTAATGELLEPEFSYSELIEQQPESLEPDIGIILTLSEETLERRKTETELTDQDKKVVAGEYFDVQNRMLSDVEDEYLHIANDYETVEQLYNHLDTKTIPTLRSRM